jgi:hypothetical protein
MRKEKRSWKCTFGEYGSKLKKRVPRGKKAVCEITAAVTPSAILPDETESLLLQSEEGQDRSGD